MKGMGIGRFQQVMSPDDAPWVNRHSVQIAALLVVVLAVALMIIQLFFFQLASFRIGILLFLGGMGGLAYLLAQYRVVRVANAVLLFGLMTAFLLASAAGAGVMDFAYQGALAAVVYASYAYSFRAGVLVALISSASGLWMTLSRSGDAALSFGYLDTLQRWVSDSIVFFVGASIFGMVMLSISRTQRDAAAVRRQLERTNRELAGEIRQRRRAETDLRSLVAHLPALLCRVDGQGRVVYADGRGLARLHLTAGQLVGKTLDEMFQGVLGGKTFAEAMAEGQNIRFSYLGVSLEGFFTPVDEGLGEGEAERVALFIDVTEQALMLSKMSGYAGDLERSNAELEQFAYVASHDLKEPIRSVSGFLNLALRQGDKDLDPLVLDCIVQARDAAGRMQTLVTDLLAYARVGRQKREPQEVDANGLMLLVNRDLRGALEQAGAELTWGELPRVVADPTQLLQVLQNLVNNAVKFQDMARVPRVQVTAKRMAGGWRFEVKDNGIGIAVENQRRIFQIFQRLHTREEYPGTGIGLALCRRIVENWGGRLGVESVVGEGSSFWFTIPTDDTSPTQPIRKGSA